MGGAALRLETVMGGCAGGESVLDFVAESSSGPNAHASRDKPLRGRIRERELRGSQTIDKDGNWSR